MITLYDDDKRPTMRFNFPAPAFSAESIDIDDNKYDGSPIVDIVAENEYALLFVEAKNFIHISTDPSIQASMDISQARSLADMRDIEGYARKMLRKLEHSLFVWVASGKHIDKPVFMILAFNTPSEFLSRERIRLTDRLRKYIPAGAKNNSGVVFDMPSLDCIEQRYGFSATVI